jgi:DNA repair protein RecO
MISKSEALVLRVATFATTSHLVTWLTPRHGRLVSTVRGALRPKSRFLGQYDLFYTCELLFYTRERNGLHVTRECAPLDTRTRLRTDWRAYACASYTCDLLSRAAVTGPQPGLFHLGASVLDALCLNGGTLPLLFWFELRLLGVLGLAPRLTACAACGRTRMGTPRPVFSVRRGGALCAHCGPASDDDTGGALTPDVLAVLRSWQATPAPRSARNLRFRPEQALAFRRILGMFLRYHLDFSPESRRIALDLAGAESSLACVS